MFIKHSFSNEIEKSMLSILKLSETRGSANPNNWIPNPKNPEGFYEINKDIQNEINKCFFGKDKITVDGLWGKETQDAINYIIGEYDEKFADGSIKPPLLPVIGGNISNLNYLYQRLKNQEGISLYLLDKQYKKDHKHSFQNK